jgi:hypothetical protein
MSEKFHLDRLGKEIKVDSYVVYPQNNSLRVGTVLKITPKMVSVYAIGREPRDAVHKYPQDCIIVEGSDVTMYVLKNA